jgi:pimeloyl-ACP methyl ester carboxylesterase
VSKFACADRTFAWRGYSIGYIAVNEHSLELPALLLVHGFGASVGHWRKNIPVLAESARVFAIDLIGFGASDKPADFHYTFENWGALINDFIREVITTATVLVGNSIGAIAVMQAAVSLPAGSQWISHVILINCSLRLLHESKQAQLPWYRRWGSRLLQQVLGNRLIAQLFFGQVKQPQTVRRILQQAYADHSAITDELIHILLKPAQDPHAVDVFMAFVRYSQGPTPEALLERLPCPAIILWGDRDPWEPIELGKQLSQFPAVKAFIPIQGAGHCPQDETPEVVNRLILDHLHINFAVKVGLE